MNFTKEQIDAKINTSQIQYILEHFNFEKVHEHMVQTGWKWIGKIPEFRELSQTAERLLYEAVADYEKTGRPYGNIGTGGFMVYYFPWGLELIFRIEKYGNF